MFNERHSDMFNSKRNNVRRFYPNEFDLSKIQNFRKNIQDLSKEEIDFLVKFAQDEIKRLYNLGFESEIDRRNEILQGRFKNGLKCPKCGNLRLNKNGKTNGRQRYMCKECRTTFDERSFSPLSNTKLSLDKWLKYCRFMLEGGTIKYCAEEVSVSVPTSFFMRHRILDVMNLCLKDEVLDGIVEADVCYINESFKGAHVKREDLLEDNFFRNNGREKYLSEKYFCDFHKDSLGSGNLFLSKKPFYRVDFKKNISENQICINTAIDRNGHIITRVVDNSCGTTNNRRKPQNMVSFFNGKLGENIILCAYKTGEYREMAQKLGIKMRQSPRPYNTIYTVNHVFKYHWELKRWLKNFNGVSTKYLNNYLSWFKFLFISKNYKESMQMKKLFMELATRDLYITKEMIKNRCVELL